ncbi:MAG: hypothetical protein WBB82_02925 [Limnothrix sp.]
MKKSDIRHLAEHGNPQAIAQLLNDQFRPHQIRVMVKQVAPKHLQIQFENSVTPDQDFVRQELSQWQKIWQENLTHTVTLIGLRFGEFEPDWQWTMLAGLLTPEARQQNPEAMLKVAASSEAKSQQQEINRQLQACLADRLWHVKTTVLNQGLVIKLTVIESGDRQTFCQIIQQALQSFELENINKIYLNVYHREQQRYLFKTTFSLDEPLTNTPQKSNIIRGLNQDTRSALLTGICLTIVLFFIPITHGILNVFLTLVHELGHAAASWIFGFPAVPSFDFRFGGGITLSLPRFEILVILVYAGLVSAAFFYRRNRPTLIWLGSFAAIHFLLLLSGWDRLAIAAMGHIAEVGVIFICGYFALGKYFCYYGGEQTLYAMLASFSFLNNIQFFSGLVFNSSMRVAYRAGKGGLLDNDLVVLSNQFLPFSLEAIAFIFLLFTLIIVPLTWLTFRYESRWIPTFYRLCQRSPN